MANDFSSRQQLVSLPTAMVKGTLNEFEIPSGHESRDNVLGDTDFVNRSYECYLRNLPISSYGGKTDGLDGLPDIDDLRILKMWVSDRAMVAPSGYMEVAVALGGPNPTMAAQSQFRGIGGHPEILLPPNAGSTLFVEGFPTDCTRREAAHIFRPFVGYKEVRLVNKRLTHSGGDSVVFCFVDFESPAHAAMTMDALQGYIFDEHNRDSGHHLKIQFARSPYVRSGDGNHGKH